MRVLVTHDTTYRFDAPVLLEPHVIRLRPRSDGSQRLTSFDLTVTPGPAGRTDCLDQDGNVVTQVWFDAPVTGLTVGSRFEVEPLRVNPFDFLLFPEAMSLPFEYAEPWRTLLAPYLRPIGDSEVERFASEIAAAAGGRTMPFLAGLSLRLFDGWTQVTRLDPEAHPAGETLATRVGSCRDLAVLFCEICRGAGLAARFVSGYEHASAVAEVPSMHAWAEVYLPGGGWRGYDPARGIAVSTGHVAVAAAASPGLATPIAGTFRGAAGSVMEFAISMRVQQ